MEQEQKQTTQKQTTLAEDLEETIKQQELNFSPEDKITLIENVREEAIDALIEYEALGGSIEEINSFAEIVRMLNERWWRHPHTLQLIERNVGELLMLMVSELSEAMEGHRKNLQDTHLPEHKMIDVELIDCLIRLFDLMGHRYIHEGIDYGKIFVEKLKYNYKRKDHTFKRRNAEGGKKY